MNITFTKTEAGFELAAPSLPAPLVLNEAVAKEFAKALTSSDLKEPAWQTDKNVWSPQTREPLGLWVTTDGKIELWVAGQTEPLTFDECAELAKTVILASARYAVGDEVITKSGLYANTQPEPNLEYDEEEDVNLFPIGSIARITNVGLHNGMIEYTFQLDDEGRALRVSDSVANIYIERAPEVQDFVVTQMATIIVSREVTVQARTAAQARALGKPEFDAMSPSANWEKQNSFAISSTLAATPAE